MDASVEDRFFARIHFKPGCWEWLGAHVADGYGQFFVGDKKRAASHRFAYEWWVGPIPKGMQLDHLCRNRGCCNPDHLEPVTASENQMRSPVAPAAINASKTHCLRGHEFTDANTRLAKTNRGRGTTRKCRLCEKVRDHARYVRRRDALAYSESIEDVQTHGRV